MLLYKIGFSIVNNFKNKKKRYIYIYIKKQIKKKDVFVGKTNHIYIAMSMHKLIEYSDNYSDTSGSLKELKFLLIMMIWLLIISNHLNTKHFL